MTEYRETRQVEQHSEPGNFAQVALAVPVHQLFTYSVPVAVATRVQPGMLVEVPFGRQRQIGCVVQRTARSEVAGVKPISRLVEARPAFSPALMALAQAVADHYLTPLGLVLKTMLPGGMAKGAVARTWMLTEAGQRALLPIAEQTAAPAQRRTARRYSPGPTGRAVLEVLSKFGACDAREVSEHLQPQTQEAEAADEDLTASKSLHNTLTVLARHGLVRASAFGASARVRTATFFSLLPPTQTASSATEDEEAERPTRLGKRQRAVLEILAAHGEMDAAALNAAQPGASGVARKLAGRKVVGMEMRRVHRAPLEFRTGAGGDGQRSAFDVAHDPHQPRILTPDQSDALAVIEQAMRRGHAASFLVHGVTGSGKTELYLHAISSALERQRGAIVLVPEIALTPQFVQRFRSRFGALVALQHSGLSAGERLDEWDRVRQGAARVVVGVRSAVFAPVENLGIIVIDEEQENSYKQEEGVFYDAREVATLRAALADAVVVRGSATPTLESYHEARRQPGAYLALPQRVTEHALPSVRIVDMRRQPPLGGKAPVLSWPLMEALATCLERGEQSILFLNRRGFSTAIICRDCGHMLSCENCSVALTYHRAQRLARCHYCDFTQPVPDLCPDCRGANLTHRGVGTQQLEAMVRKAFPQARVQRMDSDTTRHRHAYHTVLGQLAKGRLDILIGTQMIAKGHDYPGITLVGVVSADAILGLPDFRSASRTFQILIQVAGRAGRGSSPGQVIVQSYNPGHYAILCAQQHDYAAFYAHEIAVRRTHFYPPFSYLALLRVQSRNDTLAMQAGTHLAMRIRKHLTPSAGVNLEVLGPAPAVLSRLRNRFRWNLLLKADDADWLRHELARVLLPEVAALSRRAAVTIDLDLNPQNML